MICPLQTDSASGGIDPDRDPTSIRKGLVHRKAVTHSLLHRSNAELVSEPDDFQKDWHSNATSLRSCFQRVSHFRDVKIRYFLSRKKKFYGFLSKKFLFLSIYHSQTGKWAQTAANCYPQ